MPRQLLPPAACPRDNVHRLFPFVKLIATRKSSDAFVVDAVAYTVSSTTSGTHEKLYPESVPDSVDHCCAPVCAFRHVSRYPSWKFIRLGGMRTKIARSPAAVTV